MAVPDYKRSFQDLICGKTDMDEYFIFILLYVVGRIRLWEDWYELCQPRN